MSLILTYNEESNSLSAIVCAEFTDVVRVGGRNMALLDSFNKCPKIRNRIATHQELRDLIE